MLKLLIIFDKNQNMKTEKILSIIFIISLIFKLNGWPGGGPLLVLSLTILTLCYFPLGFYFLNEKSVFKQKLGTSILFGWLLAIAIIGIEFKLMYWPGYLNMLIIGIMTAGILLIFAYISNKKASTDELKKYHQNLLIRTLVLLIASLICLIIPEESIIKMSFQNDQKLKELYLERLENPNDLELQKKIEEHHKQKPKVQNQ